MKKFSLHQTEVCMLLFGHKTWFHVIQVHWFRFHVRVRQPARVQNGESRNCTCKGISFLNVFISFMPLDLRSRFKVSSRYL